MNTTTCRVPSRSEWGPRARCGQQLARGKSLDIFWTEGRVDCHSFSPRHVALAAIYVLCVRKEYRSST
jgi:hypothetical protein